MCSRIMQLKTFGCRFCVQTTHFLLLMYLSLSFKSLCLNSFFPVYPCTSKNTSLPDLFAPPILWNTWVFFLVVITIVIMIIFNPGGSMILRRSVFLLCWWSGGWSTSPVKTSWGSWAYSAWGREGCGVTSLQPFSTWREPINRKRVNSWKG